MDSLPLELLIYIFELLDFKSKIRFRIVTKFHYHNLILYDLANIPLQYLIRLDDNILEKLPHVRYLYLLKPLNIDRLDNLRSLTCRGFSVIDLSKHTNLTYLDINYNTKIKQIHCLPNLITLNALWASDLEKVDCPKLKSLVVHGCQKICKLNLLTHLTELDISNTNLNDNGICKLLGLTKLNISENNFIANINHHTNLTQLSVQNKFRIVDFRQLTHLLHLNILGYHFPIDLNSMTKLITLNASQTKITSQNILKCTNLTKLTLQTTFTVESLNHLVNLKYLDINYSEIQEDGLLNCTNLTKLYLRYNRTIRSFNYLPKLKMLDASYTNITHLSFNQCTNLSRLIVQNCKNITNVNFLPRLKYLDCSYDCGISDEGITNCTLLKSIIHTYNNKITSSSTLNKIIIY